MYKPNPYLLFFLLFLFFPLASLFSDASIRVSVGNVLLAKVYIDGVYRGTEPLTVKVSPGSHTVRTEADGYNSYSTTTYVSDGYEKSLDITMAAATGTLILKATVGGKTLYGASVYLDGRYEGTTPLTVRDVKPGNHSVRFSKSGYSDVTDTVTVYAGYEKTLTALFRGADLQVYANVGGAGVYVDSDYKGTTPLKITDLEPGNHTIKITKKHYSVYTKTETLKADMIYTLNAELEKISGYLNTAVTPADADLYCDGEKISKYNEEIDEGSHVIKAVAFGYSEKSVSVRVIRNKTQNLSLELEKAPFEIKSFSASETAINPRNSKLKNSVRFNIAVNAPAKGTLVITNEAGDAVASWPVSFESWNSYVDWDGKVDGQSVEDGVYVAVLKAEGFMRIANVTVDHRIRNYEQRARSKGFFFALGNAKGPFYDGFTLGASGFYGGKHLYGGLALDFLLTDISDDYEKDTIVEDLNFMDAEFLLGLSCNWHAFRPYTHAGIGYYYGSIEGDTKQFITGYSLSWTTGIDIVFDHFVIGGYYKLRKLNGSGYADSFGVSFGWAFDK